MFFGVSLLSVRDDELRAWLRQRNPWWRPGPDRTAWVAHDPTLQRAAALGIDYRPAVLDGVVDGGLYVVRGPRRVGKSVALKRFAAELLTRAEVHPAQVIYMSLDEFDPRTLRRALRLARDLTAVADTGASASEPGTGAQRYWLIDEVTAVPEWPAIIKSARDDTPFAFDTVILTGSSAHGLDEARRALGAGRVGPATDPFRLLLPMTFRDFLAVTRHGLPESPVLGAALRQDRATAAALGKLDFVVDDLDLAWQAYCEVGGFPRAVAEYQRDGYISAEFATDVLDWLAPDVTPGDPSESVLRLLSTLATRMTSPMNIRATAEATGVTRERLTTRLNRLRTTFATLVCPQVDDAGLPISGAQSKIYPLDPLLIQLPHLVEAGFPVPDMSAISEAVLAAAMARAVDVLHPGRLLEGRAVGYARTASGEVDLAPVSVRVAGTEEWTPPVESKWVPDGWRPEARAIERRYGGGFVATKSVLDLTHPAWAVPAGMFALLLG